MHVFYKSTSCHEFHGGYDHVHDASTSCHEFDGGYGHVHALLTSCREFDEATATSMLYRLLAMTFDGRF
jgi:hypothetical protein